ncbi:MAG TPA: Asp-tRNA(Asn)/Glu-tRNA(Gln) amidotransferase subunit GatB [bacterium]|nr:Asp-tRNA(Asn)/Glu-tRNA(Gln) amidotransferase subunit GatB [bacterium]
MGYEAIIGLEVHVQLKTKSKIFCSCSTEFGALPNSQVCPVCLGLPGVLPVLNKTALEYAIKAALALDCRIAKESIFARKNYFYPDLPKSYQISQYEEPLSSKGFVDIITDGKLKKIRITRVHLEEDAGKLLHEEVKDSTLIDFNRCGVPLIEIVTEPDIKSPREAREFLAILKSILQYIGVSDCNMEEGSLRCDANISVRPSKEETGKRGNGETGKELGVKVEIKNMNSFKAVEKALEYEMRRQIKALEEGKRIVQETRLWDENKEITISMRTKEEAHDYRYFPEPDLVLMEIDREWTERIRKSLPELPEARKARFSRDYKIPDYDAGILTSSKELADYYEECIEAARRSPVADRRSPVAGRKFNKEIANWIMSELLRELKEGNIGIEECKARPQALAEMMTLIDKGILSRKMAKEVFVEMFETGEKASWIIKKRSLVQISDEEALTKIVDKILKENPRVVEDYKKGKEKALGYLVGQVMKETKGRANPQIVNKLLKEEL